MTTSEYLKSSESNNFFLLAGPCVIEGEQMAMDIAGTIAPYLEGHSDAEIEALFLEFLRERVV